MGPDSARIGTDFRPSRAKVRLAVKSEWGLKTVYNVIAEMKGQVWPDQWVVRGNHHDGWVFGASDPLSGQVALMAEAKAIRSIATVRVVILNTVFGGESFGPRQRRSNRSRSWEQVGPGWCARSTAKTWLAEVRLPTEVRPPTEVRRPTEVRLPYVKEAA